MAPPRKDGSDRLDRPIDGGDAPEPSGSGSPGGVSVGGQTERLRGAILEGSDGDLVLERGDGDEGVLRWLRALDLQVLGACRTDERLKPLLKLNVSSGVAEERLVAQLNQHFEVSEVGMLARCLCIPLVSIRVGKVYKQGNQLCPTSTRKRRGHLNLSLLPSSNMHISFAGDDGCIERLSVVANDSESSPVAIEEIPADSSGRSFLLKLPGSQISYFWCSEKSKLRGMELLAKMKDLLRKKPSLSHLTGICETRLDSFGNHLRAYLETTPSPLSVTTASGQQAPDSDFHSSTRPSRSRLTGSLSPRLSTFKEGGMPKGSSLSNRNGVREKHKRRGDDYSSLLSIHDLPPLTSASPTSQFEDSNSLISASRSSSNSCSTPCCIPEIPCLSYPLSSFTSPVFSPYYCWCPPRPSPSTESLPLLPQLSSEGAPPVTLIPPELPSLNLLPSFFPESLLRIPRPSSQQIPTFTPFMSDPIVHIPFIDVCSAGQGYLVSAEPAISSVIAPLLPGRSTPLLPESESVVEKNARETLRMLMATEPTSTRSDTNFPFAHVVAGSRGLYSGTSDVSLMNLSSSWQNLTLCGNTTRVKHGDVEGNTVPSESSSEASEGSKPSCAGEDFSDRPVSD